MTKRVVNGLEIEVRAGESVRQAAARAVRQYGEKPGHPFRGNQHTKDGLRPLEVGIVELPTKELVRLIRAKKWEDLGYRLARGAKTMQSVTNAIIDYKLPEWSAADYKRTLKEFQRVHAFLKKEDPHYWGGDKGPAHPYTAEEAAQDLRTLGEKPGHPFRGKSVDRGRLQAPSARRGARAAGAPVRA